MPMAALTAPMPPGIFFGGSWLRTTLMASGRTPPPAPWSTRATTSQPNDSVVTASTEPSARPPSETSSIGLRP